MVCSHGQGNLVGAALSLISSGSATAGSSAQRQHEQLYPDLDPRASSTTVGPTEQSGQFSDMGQRLRIDSEITISTQWSTSLARRSISGRSRGGPAAVGLEAEAGLTSGGR